MKPPDDISSAWFNTGQPARTSVNPIWKFGGKDAQIRVIPVLRKKTQTEPFRASREELVLRLRDQEKLTFKQIGDRFDRSACRAAQIYQAAYRKIQFPPNGLSNRLNRLLTMAGFTVEKNAIAIALRAGKLYPGFLPRNYGKFAHRDVCRWAGVDPASLPYPSHHYERFPDNGLSYRTNNFLRFAGIPATKADVLKSLKNGDLTPTKLPLGYPRREHLERGFRLWVGCTGKAKRCAAVDSWAYALLRGLQNRPDEGLQQSTRLPASTRPGICAGCGD